jgi:hypothetical protein
MTADPSLVMQIVGTIIQAYASMLAIIGAFYVFIIEKNKLQSDYDKKEIERLYNLAVKQFIISKMSGVNDPTTNSIIDVYKDKIINNGDLMLKELIIDKLKRREMEYSLIVKNNDYMNLVEKIKEYKNLDKGIKKISRELYLPFASLYVIILMLALLVMGSITFIGYYDWVEYLSLIVTALSVAGFVSFIGLLVSVYRYD